MGGVTVTLAVALAVAIGVMVAVATSVGNGGRVGVFVAVAADFGVRDGGTNGVGTSANVAVGLVTAFTVTSTKSVAVARGVGCDVASRGAIARAMAAMI